MKIKATRCEEKAGEKAGPWRAELRLSRSQPSRTTFHQRDSVITIIRWSLQSAHPARKPHVERPNQSSIIFLTVCVPDKKPILASEETHQLCRTVWTEADKWLVGRYVLMPDHIHLFCAPNSDFSLLSWTRFWKTLLSNRWPTQHGGQLLQHDNWDTQMRSAQMYSEKWEYVFNNPVRAGLCSSPEDWPYQGEITRLEWHGS